MATRPPSFSALLLPSSTRATRSRARWLVSIAVACALLAPAAALCARPRLSKPVRTAGGLVQGTSSDDGVVVAFRGIPFAAPPVGALRWKPPQPAPEWNGVRAASAFGPACAQGDRAGSGSEDCLYLNIWAPARARRGRAPVMVWFHGGTFTSGNASLPVCDGETLARRGVVVVTFNYRLGPFGFFAHPLLTRESGRETSGNYGLLDQIAALTWVKANIRAFGGNPDRVTAFGQSAGAISISCLLVSPPAHGLFHAAIMESGSALSIPRVGVTRYLRDAPPGEESMEQVGELIARRLGSDHEDDVLAALRAKTTDEILAASRPAPDFFGEGIRFGPVIDRWLIPDRPAALFASLQPKIPVMIGAGADEGISFVRALQPYDVDSYRRFIRSTFRERADEVLARFPVTRDADVRGTLSRLIGSSAFIAPARRTARALASRGDRVYLYWFTRGRPGSAKGAGARHGSEVPFVFGTLDAGRPGADDTDRELSLLVTGYWARFAASGDPNGDNAPPWPRYRAQTDRSLELGEQVEPRAGMYRDACDFFDRLAADRPARSGPPSPSR